MDARYDLLPNFFIIGAPKAGTTSLYSYLRQHPDIYLPETKELHFFNREPRYARGVDYYVDTYFRGAGGFALRGEATPTYMRDHDRLIPRLKSLYGDRPLKFIACLRNPVERAFSHYHHVVAWGREHESFERGLELEDARRDEDPEAWLQYVHDGFYDEQLAPWFAAFPRSSFHFIVTEHFDGHRDEEVEKAVAFLGADPKHKVDTSVRRNVVRKPRFHLLTNLYNPSHPLRGSARVVPGALKRALRRYVRRKNYVNPGMRPTMNPATREALRKRFEPHNRALAEMLNLDLSSWQ